MKRYLLFAGYDTHPQGGMHDFKGSFDTTDEAENYLDEKIRPQQLPDWYHLVDSESGEIISASPKSEWLKFDAKQQG